MAYVFFQASQDALDNITSAFDFVHPLRASMKYARKKVAEMSQQNENADDLVFQAEIDPNGEIHGVGFRDSFLNTSWDAQEEQLAWLLLNNLFAIHEGWAQRLFEERFSARGYIEKPFIKGLEFPGVGNKFSTYYAHGNKKSNIMENAYFDVYKNTSQLDFNKLENYMLLYRYYKEARNCYMHRNFTSSQEIVDAYTAFLPKATLMDLDTEEVPVIISPVAGQSVHLSLRGVIGFSQFVRRIIIISDTYLIKTTSAEDEFFCKKPAGWLIQNLSGNITNAKRQIAKYANKAGTLKPVWSNEYQNFLIRHRIFSR